MKPEEDTYQRDRIAKGIFEPDYDSVIQEGTEIVHVTDKKLAACLLAVGIRLRKDPPYLMVERADGTKKVTFNFLPRDDEGELTTAAMIRAWKQDMKFIEANPYHPFTFAMCAIRNYRDILEHLSKDTPFHAFKASRKGKPATFLAKPGSDRYKAAMQRGWKRI